MKDLQEKESKTIYKSRACSSFEAPSGSVQLVSMLMDIINETSPMPLGHSRDLRYDIISLWRDLTSDKDERKVDYIGEPAKLAAYLRYFLPWNVVRLVPILAGLEIKLNENDKVLDIGSGPLTVPIALWIARKDLRDKKLVVVCQDRVKRAMEAGLKILEGLALRNGSTLAWSVELQKESFSILAPVTEEEKAKYELITSANVFNEGFWKIDGKMSERADNMRLSLSSRLTESGRLLIVEPGDPRSGSMLAALRESFILNGGHPLAPCTHDGVCPMSGVFRSAALRDDIEVEEGKPSPAAILKHIVSPKGRAKAPWCHFVLNDGACPASLKSFSENVGLPKDRLIASWLYIETSKPEKEAEIKPSRLIRIISDKFIIPGEGPARYACTRTGYTIVKGTFADNESGTLIVTDNKLPTRNSERDQKSGAVIVNSEPSQLPWYDSQSSDSDSKDKKWSRNDKKANSRTRDSYHRHDSDDRTRDSFHRRDSDDRTRNSFHRRDSDDRTRDSFHRRDTDSYHRHDSDDRTRDSFHKRDSDSYHRRDSDDRTRDSFHKHDSDDRTRDSFHKRDSDSYHRHDSDDRKHRSSSYQDRLKGGKADKPQGNTRTFRGKGKKPHDSRR